ncbi:MAG TPA: alpha/beta hydrolase-fold protein [Caulobacteraceae bacterium]|nr:alpha/beta hydrolase-fold protein [Caulobacteraceae bacterium]
MIDRRLMLGGGLALAATALAGTVRAQEGVGDASVAATGHVKARPGTPTKPMLAPGLHVLGLHPSRDAHLFVPRGLDPAVPAPLIVMLHGKGQLANETLGEWKRPAGARKCLVLAPQSREETWNVDDGPVGPDAVFIDQAMQAVFDRFAVDPGRMAVAGFSDGGTMCLSFGLVNGDVFGNLLAFAPIRYHAPDSRGQPRVFIANGTRDSGAPYSGSRSMARQLEGDGYDVEFFSFDGGHWMDESAVKAAMKRFLG